MEVSQTEDPEGLSAGGTAADMHASASYRSKKSDTLTGFSALSIWRNDYLGFQNRHSVMLWILVSITTTVFVTARLPLLSEWGYWNLFPPGEAFAFLKLKGRLFTHVIVVVPWAFLGAFQFVPMIRKRNIDYHKIAGRIYLLVCIAISVSGVIMAPYGFGGDLAGQLATYSLFTAFVVCFTMGYISIKRKKIQQHREWMLRNYAVGSSVIIIRIFLPFFTFSLNKVWEFYNTISCEQILFEMGDWNEAMAAFPLCKEHDRVMVKMSSDSIVNVIAGLRLSYGPATFISLLICGAAVEAWIHFTYHSGRNTDDSAADETKFTARVTDG